MARPDLGLLAALQVLLAEESVTRAALRMNLSASAMSRVLARLREEIGDPLLVRAGRRLVPTPRARDLRDRVTKLVEEGESLLRPSAVLDLATLSRTFTVRTSEGFPETFGPSLMACVAREAPGVRLRFVGKMSRESEPLREAAVDFETGIVGKETAPELRVQVLFRDRFVGVVRQGHPLARGAITPARFGAARHVMVSRRDSSGGPVEEGLSLLHQHRNIAITVSGFATAIALARATDLVACVPERHTAGLRQGMRSFELPFSTRPLSIALLWHPRQDADPAHRWVRGCFREACSETAGSG
jgi:DNA-binding transcriptional LysR family regulator